MLRTGSLPSHLIFAARHLEHAATGRLTLSRGVSSTMRPSQTDVVQRLPLARDTLEVRRQGERAGANDNADWLRQETCHPLRTTLDRRMFLALLEHGR